MPLLIVQLAILVAVAFVMGCVVGRLLRRRTTATVTDKERTIVAAAKALPAAGGASGSVVAPVARREAAAKKTVPDAEPVGGDLPVQSPDRMQDEPGKPEPEPEPGRPALLEAPRRGRADDLTAIAGIGKAVQSMLNGAGVFHYDQIAGWTADEAEWIDRRIGFPRRVERERWVVQASKLAGKPAQKRAAKAPARPKAKPAARKART
ncbi:MAG: 50S ribosomal protein L21 [Rhizobiales bacterium]|nr:50S ribosomal protein L21 [Hyphomicrobiales bacterium]OJX99494.1 MAG: hypothetical protein BGP07_05635 [Rhizobiales bacterium 63-22]